MHRLPVALLGACWLCKQVPTVPIQEKMPVTLCAHNLGIRVGLTCERRSHQARDGKLFGNGDLDDLVVVLGEGIGLHTASLSEEA